MTEYLNSSARARKKLSVLAVGTSQVVLSFEALKSAKFDLPCKEEQDKIASLLECLNERVELQRSGPPGEFGAGRKAGAERA